MYINIHILYVNVYINTILPYTGCDVLYVHSANSSAITINT